MKTINAEQLCELLKNQGDEKVVFLDVRTKCEYGGAHIEGVKNIPLDELKDRVGELKDYKAVYVQCGMGMRSKKACEMLEGAGMENVINVEGGLEAWKKCGLPLKKGKAGLPIIRQVLIVAGGLIIIGVGLAVWVDFNFFWLPLLVGCGLFYAGVSGNCMMAKLLAKMPWNK